ncbi:MAG: TonB-dependent receptor [Sphingomonas sp.]|uniref:TonB-dependent receptor n=1 Tax=Sphingomonas sp. TaxID=28214 RepID=UPI002273AAE2|nr:TonB-dependent receptor [Sphingomonas sp.]MCX8478112.1 TonB-dependent receptor [Sphingomonas sp.]
MKKLDLLAATALTLLMATPAFAQETATTTAAPAPDESQADDYQGANEIVVTATRRNETVQDVPIAITAIGPELLQNAGVENVRDLEQLAPSLQSSTGQSSATGTTIYLRGITTGGDNPGFEPAVGVFIDGVFRARAGVAIAELPELERVEVLRGPQGTLFGRNTSAGALSIFTAQPQFELGGYAEGMVGNYGAYGVKGAITGPVSQSLALRLDAGYRKRDGYIEDVNSERAINDINRWNVRGQALLDTGDITFRLIGDYYETDEQCCGAVSAVRGSLAGVIEGVAAAQGLDGLYFTPGITRPFPNGSTTQLNFSQMPLERRMAISPNRDYAEKVRDWGFSGELNWDLGSTKLTSITAYRDWRVIRNQDIDFSGIDRAYRDGYRNELTDFTQELRLQGSAFGGKLDWLIGGFYLNETNKLRDVVQIGNDGNRYVDSIFNALAGPSFGGSVQFFGSLGPTVPTPGAVFLNPAVPNSLPALTAVYGARLAPLVGCFRAQAGTAPAGLCVIPGFPSTPIPGLAALAASPLPGAVAGQGNNPDDFRVKTNAFALFTHNIINVTDKLSVTLGARWNHEKKDMTASINNNLGSCGFFDQVRAGNPAATAYANVLRQLGLFNNLFLLSCNPAVNSEFNGNYQDDFTDNEITGTAKLAYKFSDKLLAYASFDHGYKSGGYNLDQATFDSVLLGGNGAQGSDLRFGAETNDAYEIGFKASPSRAFTLNVAAFYMNFYNLQSLVFSGNNFVVQNVAKSISKGVEIESTIRPARDLTFQLGYSYISAKYSDSNDFTGTPLQGQEGRQFNNQPEHTVTIATTWTPRLTDGINGLVHVDMRYNSEVTIPSSNPDPATGRTTLFNPGYALINAAVGVQSSDGKWRGEIFVENATNQYYHITGFAVPEQTGNYAAYPGLPRFYGARVRFGF